MVLFIVEVFSYTPLYRFIDKQSKKITYCSKYQIFITLATILKSTHSTTLVSLQIAKFLRRNRYPRITLISKVVIVNILSLLIIFVVLNVLNRFAKAKGYINLTISAIFPVPK